MKFFMISICTFVLTAILSISSMALNGLYSDTTFTSLVATFVFGGLTVIGGIIVDRHATSICQVKENPLGDNGVDKSSTIEDQILESFSQIKPLEASWEINPIKTKN